MRTHIVPHPQPLTALQVTRQSLLGAQSIPVTREPCCLSMFSTSHLPAFLAYMCTSVLLGDMANSGRETRVGESNTTHQNRSTSPFYTHPFDLLVLSPFQQWQVMEPAISSCTSGMMLTAPIYAAVKSLRESDYLRPPFQRNF